MKPLSLVCFLILVPLLSQAQWTEHVVNDNYGGAYCSLAIDMDGDNDMDIVGSGDGELYVTWWENTNGSGTAWVEHNLPGAVYGPPSVHANDIDGDGDTDVLACYDYGDAIYWWRNDNGLGTDWTMYAVAADLEDAQSVFSADVDGDGDIDVIGSGEDDICWWENSTGTGSGWIEHPLNENNNWTTHQVYAGDVDGDEDMDILAATWDGDQILWWKNLDGEGNEWSEHIVVDDLTQAEGVYCVDIDQDGYTDILCFSSFTNEISWCRNVDGNGTVWTEYSLPITGYYFTEYLMAADMDLDGDVDVLAAANSGGGIRWWENTDLLGTSWEVHIVDDCLGPCSAQAVDMMGDGDFDIVSANFSTDSIVWYEQEGSPDPSPVTLTLSPTSATYLPANGGTLIYEAHLVSTLPFPVTSLTYRTDVILPNGSTYGPLFVYGFTMPALMDATFSGLTLDVPTMAPSGMYIFRGRVTRPGNPGIGDWFAFSKAAVISETGSTRSNAEVARWNAQDFRLDNQATDDRGKLSNEFVLQPVYPNPFNASATVTIELLAAGELTVAVYNLAGQRVAELVHGTVAAGTHKFAFDGSELASGIYLVHATVPGQMEMMKKVVLVK